MKCGKFKSQIKLSSYLKFIIFYSLLISCKNRINEKDLQNTINNVPIDYTSPINFFEISETGNNFIIKDQNELIFTKNIFGKIKLLNYNFKREQYNFVNTNSNNDIEKPFFINNNLSWLERDYKTEMTKIREKDVNKLGVNYIEQLFSSTKGKYIIVKYFKNNKLYLINGKTHIKKILPISLLGIIKGVAFDEGKSQAILNIGTELIHLDLVNLKSQSIATDLIGQKINPFIFLNKVYFASNANSSKYQIYSYDLLSKKNSLLLKTKNDLKQPKTDGINIYYIEISNSNYCLKFQNAITKNIKNITNKGVVYNYELNNFFVFFTYSDLITPRCLKKYNIKRGINISINCENIELGINELYIKPTINTSPAYILTNDSKKKKGIILFFHPGNNNSDYSPRWDSALLPFCKLNYIVVAPNFPSSIGYGKSHEKANFEEAITDMNNWKRKLHKIYPNTPIFYYGSSSGSTLMEATINYDSLNVKAAISAFGIPSKNYNFIKVPTIYFLGVKDPIVDIEKRKNQISKYLGSPGIVLEFGEEGHWIQQPKNFSVFFSKTDTFLNIYKY